MTHATALPTRLEDGPDALIPEDLVLWVTGQPDARTDAFLDVVADLARTVRTCCVVAVHDDASPELFRLAERRATNRGLPLYSFA